MERVNKKRGRRAQLGLFSAVALVLVMGAVAWACTAGSGGSSFVVTPNTGKTNTDTRVTVAGRCTDSVKVSSSPDANCTWNAGNKNLYIQKVTVTGPMPIVPPSRGVYSGATQSDCTITGSTDINSPAQDLVLNPTTGAISGTGVVPASMVPSKALYIICAGANTNLLWDYFLSI